MLDLFRAEVENQAQVLIAGLLALERDARSASQLESCMRAAHSLKGAARIVELPVGVDVAHAMEDCFIAAQNDRVRLTKGDIDVLLRGVDLLTSIANSPEADPSSAETVSEFLAAVAAIASGARSAPADVAPLLQASDPTPDAAAATNALHTPAEHGAHESADRALRVSAANLNRLLGLAGESRVGARWLKPFGQSLLRLKRMHHELELALSTLRRTHASNADRFEEALQQASRLTQECGRLLAQRHAEIEVFDSRSTDLANRMYEQALQSRMRPFSDGVQNFPRMLRDVGRSLGKEVRLDIAGLATRIDRDILEKLDAPLGHLLRNAIDHGIETPDERRAAGKPAEGVIRLEAHHFAGMLQVSIADDGRGISTERLGAAIVARNLVSADMLGGLSEAELMEFLFLPGFSMKDTVTAISGRGVGLDVVKNMLKEVRGNVQVSSRLAAGTTFTLQLPLTLSVIRALLVEIGGEHYAFPLAHIVRTVVLPAARIEHMQGRQHFNFDGRLVGLAEANQVLEGGDPQQAGGELSIVVVSEHQHHYGLVVDRFLGECELVVQPLDPKFGKIKDVSAGAFTEDGTPVLIIDVDDMVRSVEKLVSVGRLKQVQRVQRGDAQQRRRRVLVVEDSLTVRELERKLIEGRGYEVEVAVDGMDGWNAVRSGGFDLVVTDIDMPRMDGIELVGLIKSEPSLKSLPVMIVSYKDREEDRRRGLDAGADYYLTKGSFQDESLVQAVADLIGEASA